MEKITLTVPGPPTPKGRARSLRGGGHYTPAATRAAERHIANLWQATHGLRQPHEGPVVVDVAATFTPPTSWPKWRRALALGGTWPHLVKPDIDNLLKLVKDALNGLAWRDDSQVIVVIGRKLYGEEPATVITITFLPTPENRRPTA